MVEFDHYKKFLKENKNIANNEKILIANKMRYIR